MGVPLTPRAKDAAVWASRLAVTAVFALNVGCALSFLVRPERFAGGFELAGAAGDVAVRGFGIAFLMWNATYPPVIWRPRAHRTLFGVVIAQQTIGVAGEVVLLATLAPGHETLASGIARFAVFDAAGLALLLLAFALSRGPGRTGA